MGEIVAALGTCHTPYLFTRPPDENPQQLEAAARAMQELGTVLDETRPDAIVFLGSDHVETFSVTCIPSFAIGSGPAARLLTGVAPELVAKVREELSREFAAQGVEPAVTLGQAQAFGRRTTPACERPFGFTAAAQPEIAPRFADDRHERLAALPAEGGLIGRRCFPRHAVLRQGPFLFDSKSE